MLKFNCFLFIMACNSPTKAIDSELICLICVIKIYELFEDPDSESKTDIDFDLIIKK